MSNALNLDGTPYRTPPHSLDAERGLLGAIMLDNRVMEAAAEIIETRHLMASQHQTIYDVMRRLIDNGKEANPVSIHAALQFDGDLASIGGNEYLANIAASAAAPASARNLAEMIRDLAIKRDAITEARAVIEMAYDDSEASAVIEALGIATDKMTGQKMHGGPVALGQVMRSTLEDIKTAKDQGFRGVESGIRDLDSRIGGFVNGRVYILAARPAMGKTATALQFARNVAEGGQGVVFFSIEMGRDELATRLFQSRTAINSQSLIKGEVGDAEIPSLEGAASHYDIPIHIDDTPNITVQAMKSRAKAIRRRHGLGLVIIDYLQLIRAENRYQGQRVNEISEITRALKVMARELDVPVIVLSQLSRAVENRDDKRPHLSDLRDSGSIEQDADVVMFLYRKEYYVEQMKPEAGAAPAEVEAWDAKMAKVKNLLDVIIAKQRGGATGVVNLHCNLARMTISDLARR